MVKISLVVTEEMFQWSRAFPKCGSEHSPGVSQTPVTPVLRTPTPSTGHCGLQSCTWHTDMHACQYITNK